MVKRKTLQKKGVSRSTGGFPKSGFRLYHPDKGDGKDYTQSKGKGKDEKKEARKAFILNLDFQPLKHSVKKDTAMPGNQTIGLPAIGLTSPWLQLLCGLARKLILHGWWQTFEPCHPSDIRGSGPWQRAVDWIKSGNRKIPDICTVLWHRNGILSLQQVFRVRQLRNRNLYGKLYFQHHHILPRLMCLGQVICPYCFPFFSSEIRAWLLDWTHRETKLRVQLWASFPLQQSTQWDILCWTCRVLRTSKRPSCMSNLVTKGDMQLLPCQSGSQQIQPIQKSYKKINMMNTFAQLDHAFSFWW